MDMIDGGPDDEPRAAEGYRTPEVLAVAGFALSALCLLGIGLLNGTLAVALLGGGFGSEERAPLVAAALVSAVFAALPVALGLAAGRRLLGDEPLWVPTLARAAVLLGGLAVLLRLAQALVQGLVDNPEFVGF